MSLKGFGMNGLIKAKSVKFDDTYLHVMLEDERVISTPLKWYEPLKNATISQLKNYKLICKNTGIEWSDIDYHLSIERMLDTSQNVA